MSDSKQRDGRFGWPFLLAGLGLASATFSVLLFARLSGPLLWNDEGETAMYAERILEFGYPKVHDGRNVVYELTHPLEVAVAQPLDAYVGSPWGQYYVGAIGAALARTTDDPYAKTFWIRLPFAAMGALAVAIAAVTLLCILWPRPGWAVAAASVFVGIEASSLSLLEHLREARYYSIATFLIALGLLSRLLFLRPNERHPRWTARWMLAVVLALLFNVFSPAALSLAGVLAIDALRPFELGRWDLDWRRVARRLLPLALAALWIAPGLLYFDTLGVTARIAGPASVARFLSNLADGLSFFARHDVLLPALAAKGLVLYQRGRVPAEQRPPALAHQLGAADLLAATIVMQLLLVSRVSFVFERYLTPVGPLVAMMLVLDAISAVDLASLAARGSERRRSVRKVVLVLCLASVLVLPWRAADLKARLTEIVTPYHGPIDFIVQSIRARYPDPRSLVIATNYESPVLMYYLGSQVVAGHGESDLRTSAMVPDVVIPRRGGRRDRLYVLQGFLRHSCYERALLPVGDIPYNNIPEVSSGPGLEVVHQIRTPAPSPRTPAIEVYHRIPETRCGR